MLDVEYTPQTGRQIVQTIIVLAQILIPYLIGTIQYSDTRLRINMSQKPRILW